MEIETSIENPKLAKIPKYQNTPDITYLSCRTELQTENYKSI